MAQRREPLVARMGQKAEQRAARNPLNELIPELQNRYTSLT